MEEEKSKKVDKEWKNKVEGEKIEKKGEGEESEEPKLPPANFNTFITSMAMQTYLFLGEISNPITNKKETNLEQAKYTIDILLVMKEKTKGNLSSEEDKLLEDILADLQMRYVKKT